MLNFQSTLTVKSMLILMTCTTQTLNEVTSMTPSPSNEELLSHHSHSPSMISQPSIHPPSTPVLEAAQVPVVAHLGGLMRLRLPVPPLSGADPDGSDDHSTQPSPPQTPPPPHQQPRFSQPPSLHPSPPPPPAQNDHP